MLTKQPWMKGIYDLKTELIQAEEEGKDISSLREKVERVVRLNERTAEFELEANHIYDEIQELPTRDGYPYVEPNSLHDIHKERPWGASHHSGVSSVPDDLYDRIYGGWLGRCSGCLLGQPVEGWHRPRIVSLLKETGNYPMKNYISSDLPETIREKYNITDIGGPYGSKLKNWINNVSFMPEDDDINYTVTALKLIEDYGPDFSSEDVAEVWLHCLPLLHTCTAERIAYINLANLVLPPLSAVTRNPYREWIGAQIRADLFGYVNPGNPERAAAMAFRDAAISHVKNGIYGEMFVAAMIASAFVTQDPEEIICSGLSQIPRRSRMYERIKLVLEWRATGIDEEQAIKRVHELYDEKNWHDWTHTISNAMIVAIGLLYGKMDFEASVAIGTVAGFDTDCNSATIGSVIGVTFGARCLPSKWIEPLNDKLKSGVDGFGLVNISALAERTVALVLKP